MNDLFDLLPKNTLKPAKGRVLLSDPFMSDLTFSRTVILLADYKDEGAIGFVLNKPLIIKIHDLIENFPDFNGKVYAGGPVDTNHLYYIHTSNKVDGRVEIIPGLYWGGDFEQIKKLIEEGSLHNGNIRFFAGYSGWGEHQLEDEIKSNSWYVAGRKHIPLFNEDEGNTMWTNVIKELGKEFTIVANIPENPSMN